MKQILFAGLLAMMPAFAQPLIQTVAGGGPNNVPALSLTLPGPWRVAGDSAGNTYIGNSTRVYRVTPGGTAVIVAGNGGLGSGGDGGRAVDASLYVPTGIAVDSARNLIYIADVNVGRVRRIDLTTGLITAYAGTGTNGTNGDGIPATSAELSNPRGLALDSAGNLYIVESQRIRKVALATGIITVVAGQTTSGTAVDGAVAASSFLNNPTAVAVDGFDNVYIVDQGSYRILRVSGGLISTFAGKLNQPGDSGDGGLATAATLGLVYGVAANGTSVYISDTSSNRIRRVALASNIISAYAGISSTGGFGGDGGPATAAQLSSPLHMALFADGSMVFADFDNSRYRRVSAGGTISTIAGNGSNTEATISGDGGPAVDAQINLPGRSAYDATANAVYFTDTGNNRIRKLDLASRVITTIAGTGTAGTSGDNGLATLAQFNFPDGLAVDTARRLLYISDTGSNRVRVMNLTTGAVSAFAGTGVAGATGNGGPAASAQLNAPTGLAVDSAGNLYIADTNNNVVRKVTITGTPTINLMAGSGAAFAEGGLATSSRLQSPVALAVDNTNGQLYIADVFANRIRRVNLSTNLIFNYAGNGNYGSLGDGGAATAAELKTPRGVALDGSNNLYIADTESNRVRVVNRQTNVISLVAGTVGGFGGDGGSAEAALLSNPRDIVFDAAGLAYVADTGNNRVRTIGAGLADLTSPTPGSVLSGPSVAFSWYGSAAADAYWLDIGTAPGSGNICASGAITTLTFSCTSLPQNGSTVYVQLFTRVAGNWQTPRRYTFTAASASQAPFLITPTPSSQLPSTSVAFTWNSVATATGYWLDIGTAVGSGNICASGVVTTLTFTCSGIPTTPGATIYAQIWALVGGVWRNNRFTYTAPGSVVVTPATLTSPTPGSTLTGSSVTFSWTAGVLVDQYWLDVGTAFGQGNLTSGALTATSKAVSGLPTNGSTVYVRLWSRQTGGGYLTPIDFTFTATSTAESRGVLLIPVPGATLTSNTVSFSWKPSTLTGADGYWLDVGPTLGSGAYSGGFQTGLARTATGIPCNGSTVYARLWTRAAGLYQSPIDYTYTAAASCAVTDARATLTLPSVGSTLSGASVTFGWTAGTGATQYWLDVGTALGQGNLSGGVVTTTSKTVSGLPTDGSLLYVRLWTFIGGAWQTPIDYLYKSGAGASDPRGQLLTPAPGSTITGTSATFTWSAGGAGVDGFWLDVGTAPAAGNLSAGFQTGTSRSLTNLPGTGSGIVYVRLWTRISGVYQTPIDYVFNN